MLEQRQQRARTGADALGYRRRMLLALALLLTALIVMLVKDHTYCFGGDEMQAEEQSTSTPVAQAASVPDTAAPAPAVKPAVVAKTRKTDAPKHIENALSEGTSIVATNRGVLPPLEVEVVNGKAHHPLQANTGAVKVDMESDAARELAPITNAVERTRVEANKTEPSQPSYPSLAGQMKVQGSVLLQALVAADGIIQELRVVSGPAILASAAREAAKQWRFKPYLQNGKPVETQARITVNFVIKVWDDEARIHQTAPAQTAQVTHPGE